MRLAFPIFCVLLLVGGCSPSQDNGAAQAAAQHELEKLQGDWDAIAHEFRGLSAPNAEEYFPYRLSIVGDKVTVERGSKKKEATVSLEPTKKPKKVTFHYPPHFASWGTYDLKGEELTITWATGKNTEPSESERATVVLKRVKAP